MRQVTPVGQAAQVAHRAQPQTTLTASQQPRAEAPAARRPRRQLPIVTALIVIACIAVFLYDRENGATFFEGSVERVVGNRRIENLGEYSLYGPSLEFDGEWYRILTAGFIHFNGWHLGVNMVLLWSFGSQLERHSGSLVFATLFVASVLGGSLGALVLEPDTQSGGASGAVFALVGVMAVMQLFSRRYIAAAWFVLLIGLDIALSFAPGISLGGHLGGLVVGVIAGLLIGLERRRRRTLIIAPVGIAATGFAAFAGIVAVVLPLGDLSFQL